MPNILSQGLCDFEAKIRNLGIFTLGLLMFVGFSLTAQAQTDSLFANPGHSRVIEVGTSITLDGSGSTSPSGLRLTYAWSLIQQPTGSLAILDQVDSPHPNLVPDLAGDYIAQLIVTDTEGNTSPAQTVLLTTNNVPPVAVAGPNRFTTVGQSLRFDPEGTYDANGDSLTAEWSISSFPSSSNDLNVEQDEFATLNEDESGRFVFTPKVPGDYSIQLIVEDEDGAQSTDIVNVYAAPSDGSGIPLEANIAPVANAGFDQLTTIDEPTILDGSRSSDINGDMLSYRWSILSKPADSFSVLENASAPIASLTPDTDRTYILQLAVTDMNGLTDYDTVVLSGEYIAPVAISGGPSVNSDGAIANQEASVDGNASLNSAGLNTGLEYEWSVLGLSAGDNEIDNVNASMTDIRFPQEGEAGILSKADAIEGSELLQNYNVFTSYMHNSGSDTHGRVIIGGKMVGPSSRYGTGLNSAAGIDVLQVEGNIRGGTKTVKNGGNLRTAGHVRSQLNFKGGGELIHDYSLEFWPQSEDIRKLSWELCDLQKNSHVIYPHGWRAGTARLIAQPDENGIAVFHIRNANYLFNNRRIRNIKLERNGAKTVIINVGGRHININKANFIGEITTDDNSEDVLWNFHQAYNVNLKRHFEGSILAPYAFLQTRAPIDGSVAVARLNQRAPIGFPLFKGEGLIEGEGNDATKYALVQLAAKDTINGNLVPSFSSTVLTIGNLRPVAKITKSGGDVVLSPGVSVGFNGALSSDGNNDVLSFDWAVLSKPEGSSLELANNSNFEISVTPTEVGFYVVQLQVSDGELTSRPATFAFEIQNTAPTANAGLSQSVFKGELVSLDGSASSDPDGDDITYAWSISDKPIGSQAVLADFETVSPSFVADVKGEYTLSLVVNDGAQDSEADLVVVSVINRKPVAVISGTSEGFTGDMISVSAIGSSDPDDDPLSYIWTLQSPAGSTATLSDNTVLAPMFTADAAGTYTLGLVVSDGTDNSEPVSFSVNIEAGNQAPILGDIGSQTVALGTSLAIGLTASDIDGDALSFFVNPVPLPAGATFDSNTGIFTFQPTSLMPESYTLSFGVSDGVLTDSETISLVITNESARPTTEYTGRVVDALTGAPISGVTVKVGEHVATTDVNGFFTATDLPSGPVIVCIEPNATTPVAPNGNVYGSVEFTTTLIANVSNEPVSDIRLAPSVATSAVTQGQVTVVSDDSLGISLQVPADGFEVFGGEARFWRVLVTEINSRGFQSIALGEMEFRSESGVTQRALGGEPLSSGQQFSFRGNENAFDGDVNTEFESTRGAGGNEFVGFIGYDYGEGGEIFIEEISMTSSPALERRRNAPSEFEVQTSDNGANWTTLKSFTSPEWANRETREFDLGIPYQGDLSISSISPEQANVLPDGIVPCQLFTIGPKNVVSVKPVTLTVDNYDNLPSGAAVDVWSYRNNRFRIIGTGIVSDDAQGVVATLENIAGGSMIALAPRTGAIEVASDVPGRTYVPSMLNEGNFSTSLSLPGYSSNGQNRALSFVYNSTAAAPSPIISANYRASSLIPNELSAQIEIGGVRYGVPTAASTGEGEGALTEGQIARQAVQLDAGNLAVGRNSFKFISTSKFACTTVSSETTGEVFVDNQIDSPFGRGWTMAELSRLYPQENGSVVIREGTGQIKDFKAQTDFSSLEDPIRLPLLGPSNGDIFDLDNDGDNDIVWQAEERGGLVIYENLGDGNFEEKLLLEAGNVRDVPETGSFFPDITRIAIGDVDNDGSIDIVTGSQFSDKVLIFFGSATGLDAYNKVEVDSTDSRAVGVGDMDGDGIDDIISFGGSLGTNSYFYKGGPTRSFTRQRLNGSTDARAVIGISTADFNQDGLEDAIARTSRGSYVFLGVVDNVPALSTVRSASLTPFLGDLSEATDFTKDGRPDYLVGSSNGKISLYQQNANGSLSGFGTLEVPGEEVSEFDLADLNGDGIDDVLSRTGTKIVTWFGLEEGGYGEPEIVETGFPFNSPVLGDLNGDGAFDVVGDSQSTDELLLYFSDPTRSNRYIDPLTDYTELTRNDDGSYTRRYNDGTVLDYNAAGLQTSIKNANGNATRYEYDSEDRVTSITDPVGLVTTFTYGTNGKLSRITYPDGRSTQWDYNAAGDLVRYEDVNGDVTVNDYDEAGRITAITDARGLVTEHNYGPYGRYQGATLSDGTEVKLQIAKTLGLPDLGGETGEFVPADQRETSVTDGRGNVTLTEVNALGSPVKVTDPLGRITLYERDINNNVTAMIAPSSVTDNRTLRTEFDYDARGNVIAKREAVGTPLEREMLYEYEPVFNKVISMTDYDGFETTYTYDGFSNILTETDPRGGVQSFSYDSAGLPLTSADKNNNQTTMFYNLEGRLERMTDPSGTVTTYDYDGAGNLIRLTEDLGGPLERETLMTYDEKNRMITETAADEGITTYAYDGNDNVISVTDPTGITETRSYDVRDRLETINDPATGATIMDYDEDSNITRMTDALGETTEFEYDAVDRLLSSIDAKGQLRAFAYDARDNITAITDARANISLITYDELDRPRSRSNPKGETWQFAYDLRDNRTTATKPDGTPITSVYDELSRLTSLTGGDVARDYSYDAQSNLLAANDNLSGSSGPQLGFSYDAENRVETASVTNLFGAGVLNNTFTYSYDAHDRRASLADSFSGNTAYAYDAVDRLTQVTTPQADIFTTNYDLAGRTLGRVAGNATEMIRQYEAATGRLSSQQQRAGGASFNGFDYSYTERGNIAAITESGEVTRERAYSYDELERLTEVSVPTSPTQDEAYELDPEGNRLSSHLSDMHSTDTANRLESDDSYTYVYDLNGNLISKLAKAGTGLSDWAYRYDALDQLIEVSQDSLVVESYRYDAFGRRSLISTVEGAGLTTDVGLINDGSDRAIDVVQGALGQAIPLRRYTHSANVDEPLQLETFTATGSFDAAYTYHADHLGSIRYLTDVSGAIVNAYDYDSYGRPMFGMTSFDQPFAYTGREWDAATGLYHYRARAYDAETGRFLQEDPIGFAAGDLNVYRYVLSNPLTYTDPSGLSASGESAGTNSAAASGSRIASKVAIGMRINCIFTAIAAGIELAMEPDLEALDVVIAGSDTAMACGAKAKFKKKPKGKGSPCKKKCFAAGTLVHTREGLKPIEQIVVGDEVKSMNPQTGEIAYKKVTQTHTNHFDPVGVVSLTDETDDSETHLSVTATHPFYHAEKGWVHASLLKVGDNLTEDDGGTLTVTEVNFNQNSPINLTYNLEVADFHTYFVGGGGVLVHNGNGPYNFGQLREAYEKACKLIGGCKGLPKFIGKNGSPSRGDSKCGIRLDPPHGGNSPHNFWHINVWDYRKGKKGKGGINKAIEIMWKD